VNSSDIAKSLREDISWTAMNVLVNSIGTSLNSRKMRFHKSDLFEKAIEKFSTGKLQYLDDVGRDFFYPKHNVYVEMKYSSQCLHTKTGKKKEKINELILLNSRSTNKHLTLPSTYSEFIMIVDEQSSAVVDKKILNNYIQYYGDGISAKNIPMSEVVFITAPSDFTKIHRVNLSNYVENLENLQNSYLNDIVEAMKLTPFDTKKIYEPSNNLIEIF
jgi:hypothetical protein